MKFVTWMILWVGVLSPVAQNANAQTTINLWDLDGSNGFILTGLDGGDRSATAIASGDINDDGIDDLIIGAQRANLGVTPRVGETYVVFGSTQGFDARFDLSSLDGSNGFVISGVTPNEESGRALAVADLNGDGVDDIIIGGTGGDGALLRGATYVVYGASAGFPAILSVDKYRRHEWVCRPRT